MSNMERVSRKRLNYGTQDKEEIINNIKILYEDGNSQKDISKLLNIPRGTISRWMVERGIKGRDPVKASKLKSKKYDYDENYFEIIDSREKAYIVGFIIGDGYLIDKASAKSIGITLSKIDENHLKNIAKIFNLEDSILEYDTKRPNENIRSILRINSTKMVNDLIKLGINFRKTGKEKWIEFNNEDLQWSFIRGFFDADGSVRKFVKDKKRPRVMFTGNKDFLDNLLNFLKSKGIAKGVNSIIKKQGCYDLYVSKLSDIEKMFNKMYEYPEDIKLERKYIIFSSLVIESGII